jgi:hypothetical protein
MFTQLFCRNIVYLRRNPRTFQATIFNSIFLSVVFGAILWMVAHYNYDGTPTGETLSDYDLEVIRNWAGASTMIMNNIYNWSALGCIL